MPRTEPTILVSADVAAERLADIAAAAPGATILHGNDGASFERHLPQAQIVAGSVPQRVLAQAEHLKWVHSWAAGPDHQLYPEFAAHTAMLTSSAGNGAVPLAEHAMMLMLMLNRNALRWIDSQRAHRWDRFTHAELNGLTLGIIGAGHSGTDLALKAKAFHMRVLGLRRSDRPAPNFDQFFQREQLHAMLEQCDFVVVTAPLTPETKGMIDKAALAAMKPSAFIVCFSRGGIIDDAALLSALQDGRLAGAGLDAHGQEPLPAESPFWDLPNTLITPHNGATTEATRERGFAIFLDNLRRYVAGRDDFVNRVDKAAGY
ncbi:D-2-hydroxyacid dehydrogenase [Devosia chinhatensis]|uniref:2-hydroxyacid dehydrogenase n=1 Tax=Devosia chinhatensis TaxID=429727 RepID=A0A0F5FMT5_9HYPH|nr:D-2-hydroxyacid dehydrogenase [Devosia chinhatensis]KKB09885.1 2-hydroxyacid dehydrogenase [Devosia chinhatensis]